MYVKIPYRTVRYKIVPYEHSRIIRMRGSNHVPLVSQPKHMCFQGLRLFNFLLRQIKRTVWTFEFEDFRKRVWIWIMISRIMTNYRIMHEIMIDTGE